MASLDDLERQVLKYDGYISTNYSNLSGLLSILKLNVATEVISKLESMNPTGVVTDTVELDANWWGEHASELGWVKDGDYYCYTDPDSGETFMYNPNKHAMRVVGANGKVKAYQYSCRLYLNGELSDVNETATILKGYEEGVPCVGDHSNKPQLVIAPELTGDEEDKDLTALRAFYASKMGDALLKSGGNDMSDVSHNIVGFSMGGVQACRMVAGGFGKEYVGYYDQMTLVNITPALQYGSTQMENMKGMTINVVQNYHNLLGKDHRDGVLDFCTSQYGGPHLEHLSNIPDATINLIIPDVSMDNYGSLEKLEAYARGLERNNINIMQYKIPDGELSLYGDGGYSSSHGKGRTILLPAYLSGDLEPIE